jgi:alpha-mannosidase
MPFAGTCAFIQNSVDLPVIAATNEFWGNNVKQPLHLIGNAHIDIFWLWRWEEGFQEIRATFASALDRIAEHGDFVFTSACAYYYSLVEAADPGLFKRIQEAVKAGRWCIAGGWWLQPDCNAPAGESFARHGLYAQRYFKEKFGRSAKMGYNVDSFGHNGNLPQLLKKAGLDGYVFMRPGAHEKTLPAVLFDWEGVDGTRIRAHRLLTYGSGGDAEWGERLAAHIGQHIAAAEKEGTPIMCFYGVGNHGGGPTKQNLKTIDDLKAGGKNIVYSDPRRYFEEVSGLEGLPVVKDEMQYHAIGCYSALSRVKRANNFTEQQLMFAEKMLAVTGASDRDLAENTAALREGWKKTLANQFHDSLGGCSIPEAYPKILAAYAWGQETANQMTVVLFQRLAAKIATFKEDSTVIVWNPHPWEVRDTIEVIGAADRVFDIHGVEIPAEYATTSAVTGGFFSQALRFNVTLPPLGYTSYRLQNLRSGLDIGRYLDFQYTRTASNWLCSGDWEALIDRESGFITSFRDKKTGTEFLGGRGIGPVIVDDESDTWTHALSSYQGARRPMALESYTLVSQGPVSTEYEIVYKLFHSTVIFRVNLNGAEGRLDIKVRVIWNEQRRLLKLCVGSAFAAPVFSSEIPYGAIERAADETEWPLQRWAKLSCGGAALAVLNDGIYSGSASEGSLDLTLLRSPIYANHETQHPRPDLYHRYVDQGEQEFSVRLRGYPGGVGNDEISRRALELNQPPVYVIESIHGGELPPQQSFCGVQKGSTALISTIKRAEDNDGWIVRAVEAGGRETRGDFDFAWLGLKGSFSFGPYEVKTIKIADRDGTISETNLLEL